MIREILVPTQPSLTLQLPAEYVGKRVEVIAFEVENAPAFRADQPPSAEQIARRVAEIRAIMADHLVDLSNFKFDRDEANNYDE